MTIFYQDGFYDDNNGPVPQGAVAITDELYEQLIIGQSNGQIILADDSGMPFLLPFQPSEYHTWNGESWVVNEEKQAELLVSQQTEVWEKIKQKRFTNGRNGVYVASVDKWFHSDDASRQQYTFLRTLKSIPANTMWKTMDNSFVNMTKTLLDELSLAMFAHEQADFANAERHRLAMLQAEKPLEYDYSTGWQEVFNG